MRRLYISIAFAVIVAACSGGISADGTTPTSSAPEPTATEAPLPAEPDRIPADGDTVGVLYTGTLDDGEEFDSNIGRDPLTFVVGSGQVISGFDDAVRGLRVGESITVRLEPADAYGEKDLDLIIEVPTEGAPSDLVVGGTAILGGQRVTVLEIREDVIVVDANPRLAGEALTFTIELVSIS